MDLQTAAISPVYALGVSIVCSVVVRVLGRKQYRIPPLVIRSVLYIGLGLVLSLAYTILGMWHYESTTGYSAGNGPLGWIFIYAPLSVACGFILGLIHWLVKDVILYQD